MFITHHLNGPIFVWRYRAPLGSSPTSRTILSGREEVEFFLDGEGYFSWEGKEEVVHVGSTLWHLPGEETIYRNNPSFPYECLILSFPVSGEPIRQAPKLTQWDDPLEARAFAMELLRIYHRDNVDKCRLAQYIYMRMLWNAYDASARPSATELPRSLQKAMQLLETEFAHSWHIAEIAAQLDISAAHLHRLFILHLEMSPYQYLLKLRLQEARRLLASTDLLVKEISYACGFNDVVNFCRCFKVRFQTTPAGYRLRNSRPS